MQTRILDGQDKAAIKEAAEILEAGHLVAFPTDTVYGLGAKVTDSRAIERLYHVKGRSTAKGIPILIADISDLSMLAARVPPTAQELIDAYWPGPLTVILRGKQDLPANLSPDDTFAVRMPDNEIARRFIRAAGGAVATTSANRSGKPPALSAEEVIEALGTDIEAVLDGGPVSIGIASTIIDFVSDSPKIIRQGPIRLEEAQSNRMRT